MALVVVRQPAAGARRLPRVLCCLPDGHGGVIGRRQTPGLLVLGACVIAIAGLAADATAQAASPWRHAYALPVVVGALTLGLIGGTVTALASLMAQAPTLFIRVEAVGLGAGAVDELVSTAVSPALHAAVCSRGNGRSSNRRALG